MAVSHLADASVTIYKYLNLVSLDRITKNYLIIEIKHTFYFNLET